MTNLQDVVKFLYHVPMFRSLNKGQLERLAKRFVEREFAAGTQIVTQGQGGEGLFILYSGKVEVIRERSDGEKVVVNQMGVGDFLGELALLDSGVRTATAVATEVTNCLVLTRWDFVSVVKEDPEMALSILEELARRFRQALDRL